MEHTSDSENVLIRSLPGDPCFTRFAHYKPIYSRSFRVWGLKSHITIGSVQTTMC